MAYTLQAIISDDALLRANCPSTARVVALPQGKAMIPICGELLEENEISFLPLTDGGENELSSSIAEFVSPLVGRGRFIYVEAEFFGGVGTQACVTWDANGIPSTPKIDPHAINLALKFLGVQVGGSHDEFDALSLGRHRATSNWLTELSDQSR